MTPEELYKEKLERYERMSKWCESASIGEQLKMEQHIIQVINDCNDALNVLLRGKGYEKI